MAIPPPPPGFTLDQQDAGDIPPPPPGFTLDQPQAPTRMDRQQFNTELMRRIRDTDETPEQIQEWARSIYQPATENAADLTYALTDRAADEIAAIRGQPNVPARVIDITERNTGFAPTARGAADALLRNRGDEVTAGLRTGFGLLGNYNEALLDERAARALDDPTDRFFGQLGEAGLEVAATGPLMKLAEGAGRLGQLGQVLTAGQRYVMRGGSIPARAGRAAVVGAGQGAAYSSGALTGDETLGEAAGDVAAGTAMGAGLGAVTSPAIDLAFAGGRKLTDLVSPRSGATSALEGLARDVEFTYPQDVAAWRAANPGREPTFPDIMRQRFAALQQQLGRQPSLAEVVGPQGARLTKSLSAAPENPDLFGQRLTAARDEMTQGIRQRRGTQDFEGEQDAAALAGIRRLVGSGEIIDDLDRQLLAGSRELLGDAQFAERQRQALLASLRRDLPADLPQQERAAMQAGVEQQIAGLDARGPLALRQAQKELDDANYSALREVSTPVDPKDIKTVNDFLASVNIESRTKTEIREALNKGRMITGDAYEKIRRGLRDRWLSNQIGSDTYRLDAENLDAIFGPFLPQVGAARQASFEARSATEGSALGMRAVGSAGQNKPATLAEALDTATPQQMAGVPSGAVQEVRNQTRTADSTYSLAEQVVSNRQYTANLKRVLPGGMADGLISFLTNSKRAVDRATDLAMDKATANGRAAYDFAEKLQDPRFAQEFRAAMGEQADDIIAEASRQKSAVDALENLNLPNAVQSVSSARKFASRVAEDDQFRKTLRDRLPPNISGPLIDLMTAKGGLAGELEAAGIRTAGETADKANAFINRIATDDKFATDLARNLPGRAGRELVRFAKAQKALTERARNLGLNKAVENPTQSYQFAERVSRDPNYANELRQAAPDIADSLITYALGHKQAIDSLAAISRMTPEQVATSMDSLQEMARAGFLSVSGGVAKAGFIANVSRETLGIGKGAARKLADDLLDPAKFESAMRLLERRGVSRDKVNEMARQAVIAAFSGNTEMPQSTVSVIPPEE